MFSSSSNASLFDAFAKKLPKATDKVFAITGTTSGTGFIAARTVAENGGTVVLLNRSSPRSDASLKKLQEEVPHGKFVQMECDLQDFASVRAASQKIIDQYDHLYCLANNAGIMATPDKATKDGYDNQMQTNHLSHFLLTAQLFPLLVKGAKVHGDSRIVNHSSVARHTTVRGMLEEKYFGKNGGNLGGDVPPGLAGPAMSRYQQSKLANSVYGYALHDKLSQSSNPDARLVRSVIAHPGISASNLFDHLDANFRFQSVPDGSMGLLTGMLMANAESGVLYGPKLGTSAGAAVPNPPQQHEIDPKAKEMLWRTSEEAVGMKFDI